MDNRPKYNTKILKLLEENTGENLCDLGLGNIYRDTISQSLRTN